MYIKILPLVQRQETLDAALGLKVPLLDCPKALGVAASKKANALLTGYYYGP